MTIKNMGSKEARPQSVSELHFSLKWSAYVTFNQVKRNWLGYENQISPEFGFIQKFIKKNIVLTKQKKAILSAN